MISISSSKFEAQTSLISIVFPSEAVKNPLEPLLVWPCVSIVLKPDTTEYAHMGIGPTVYVYVN